MFSHQSSTVVSELPKDALVHVLSGCSAHEHGAIRLCSLEWKRLHEQHVTTRLRAGSIPDRAAVYRLECRAFVSELDLSSSTCNITPGCSLADFIGEASTGLPQLRDLIIGTQALRQAPLLTTQGDACSTRLPARAPLGFPAAEIAAMKGLRRLVVGCGDLQDTKACEETNGSSSSSHGSAVVAEVGLVGRASWLSPPPPHSTTAGGLLQPLPRPQLLPDSLPTELFSLEQLEVLELHGMALLLPAGTAPPAAAAPAGGGVTAGAAGPVEPPSAALPSRSVFPKLHSLMLSGSAAQLTQSLAALHRLRPSLRALHLTCTDPTAIRVVPEPGEGGAAADAVENAAGYAAGDGAAGNEGPLPLPAAGSGSAPAARPPPMHSGGIEFDFRSTGLGGWGRPVGPVATPHGASVAAGAAAGGSAAQRHAASVPGPWAAWPPPAAASGAVTGSRVVGMLPVNSAMFQGLNRLMQPGVAVAGAAGQEVGFAAVVTAAAPALAEEGVGAPGVEGAAGRGGADGAGSLVSRQQQQSSGLQELSYRGFYLTLPLPQLRRWTSLQALDLSHNKLVLDQGFLVSQLAELTRLTRLDLSHNCLGALPQPLCTALLDLRELDLSSNCIPHLPADLTGLSRLTRLAVADNCLGSLEAPPPPPAPAVPPPTADLLVPASPTQEKAPAAAVAAAVRPLSLGTLPSGLQVLDVSGNRLVALPNHLLLELPELRVLRAARNRLQRLPAFLPPCARDCGCICTTSAESHKSPPAADNQPQYQDQQSSGPSAHPASAAAVRYCCQRCCCAAPHRSRLRLLDVSANHLSVLPAAELFGGLAQLQVLAVGQNYFKAVNDAGGSTAAAGIAGAAGCGGGQALLPPLLSPLLLPLRLMRLDIRLAVCSMRKEQATSFLEAVGGLTSLTCLQAQSNTLQRLPDCWSRLTRLTRLELAHNRLAQLPPGLAALRCLRHLDVSHNCLVGLPGPVLAALTALTALDASVNLLATLPDCLAAAAPPPPPLPEAGHPAAVCPGDGAGLTRLQVLDLHYNSLCELPASLSRLVALRRLDVCRNYGLRRLPPGTAEALTRLLLVAVGKELAELAMEDVETHAEVPGEGEGCEGSAAGGSSSAGVKEGQGQRCAAGAARPANELRRLAMRGVRIQVVP